VRYVQQTPEARTVECPVFVAAVVQAADLE
jgi:hypothetical protein